MSHSGFSANVADHTNTLRALMAATTSTTQFSGGRPPAARCYRHSDRETNVACSNCGRPICPDCMHPSPVGMRCPECASDRTQVIRSEAITGPSLADQAPVTFALIALNVLAFVAEIITGGGTGGLSGNATGTVLQHGVFWGPGVADGEWWRILSSGFLHLSLIHIGMNMLLLYFLGQMLESVIGSVRFAAIYFAALVGGSLGSLLLEPSIAAAGASGAVFGLMGAALVASRSFGVNPWESGIGGLIVLNLIITFAIPGIAKGGHLGGLIVGFVIGVVLIELDGRRHIFGLRNQLPSAVIGAAATLGLAVLTIIIAQGKFPPLS